MFCIDGMRSTGRIDTGLTEPCAGIQGTVCFDSRLNELMVAQHLQLICSITLVHYAGLLWYLMMSRIFPIHLCVSVSIRWSMYTDDLPNTHYL